MSAPVKHHAPGLALPWLYSRSEVLLNRMSRTTLALCCSLVGCWKLDSSQLPVTEVAFEPEAGTLDESWRVQSYEVPLLCPDRSKARFYFLYPESAVDNGDLLPAAVLYPSGSFDFVFAPTPGDVLSGTHFAEPSRLDSGWAIRHTFVTLGMLPEEFETEQHTGALPLALAEEGVAVMIPVNCWGDMWHNRANIAGNDFPSDLFNRDGRTAAEWGYEFLVDPLKAASYQVDLPVQIDANQVYLIGLGEGGRAVTEVLSVDADADGLPDYSPAGALIDSHTEDLSVLYDDPSRFGNAVAGLNRIFVDGDVDSGSLATANLPDRFGYVFAEGDSEVPIESHERAISVISENPGYWLYVDADARHILLNNDDIDLARDAVAYLRTGVVPGAGDGNPIP